MSLCLSCSSSCILSRSVKDIYAESSPAVFLLEKADGYCSSFHVGNGLVVTAAHCIDGEEFTIHADAETHIPNPKVLLDDDEFDVALLQVPEVKERIFLIFGGSDVPVGERLTTIGFPGYLRQKTVDVGYVISTGSIGKEDIIFGSGNAYPGESGGPVLNEFGQVVGIVSRIRPDGHVYQSGRHLHRDISVFVSSDTVQEKIHQVLTDRKDK